MDENAGLAKKNEKPLKFFFLDISMEFEAVDQLGAKELHNRLIDFLEANDIIVTKNVLSVESEEGSAPIHIFEQEENDADRALRKLTENRGNKLWVSYLESQLEMAKMLK